MLISFAPNGRAEAYTDVGEFICILPEDHPLARKTADDGGPGSGNFGHKGRPGKVGGSGPGGGKQYRGGRADIGYFGSRKDWLNGLQGEKQHAAIRFIAEKKRELDDKLNRKKKIEAMATRGFLTPEEAKERFREIGMERVGENASAEEYVMKGGSIEDREKLLESVGEARSWKDRGERLQRENLEDKEKEILSKVVDAYQQEHGNEDGLTEEEISNNNLDRVLDKLTPDQQEYYLDMKAKACGLPNSGKDLSEYSDEFLIQVGEKEPEKIPEKKGPDYGWYKPTSYGNMEALMADVAGETVSMGHRYTQEEFEALNQKFIDQVKYGKLSPNQVTYYGIGAVGSMRQRMDLSGPKPTKEMADRLTDEEKRVILETVNRFKNIGLYIPQEDIARFEDLTFRDMELAERSIERLNMNRFRSASAQKPFKDYILAQEKMLIGAEPTAREEREKSQQNETAAKEAKERAAEVARTAYLNSPEVQSERDHAKELREARRKKQHPLQSDTTFSNGLGSRYTIAAALMNNCGNVDAQVAWDIHSPEINIRDTGGGCSYSESSDTVSLSRNFQDGDSIHAPWESLYHEVGHAIDHKAARKFGWPKGEYFSSRWHNGEFCDTIEKEANAFIDKITEGAKEEFESTDFTDSNNYKLLDKYYDRGTQLRYDISSGRKTPKWSIERKRMAATHYLNGINGLERGILSDVVQGATRSKISPNAGHANSYYQGKGGRENMGTECFAELYSAAVRNPDALKAMKEHFPKTVECFNQMLKEISERG